jgi:hypothetical protein
LSVYTGELRAFGAQERQRLDDRVQAETLARQLE